MAKSGHKIRKKEKLYSDGFFRLSNYASNDSKQCQRHIRDHRSMKTLHNLLGGLTKS